MSTALTDPSADRCQFAVREPDGTDHLGRSRWSLVRVTTRAAARAAALAAEHPGAVVTHDASRAPAEPIGYRHGPPAVYTPVAVADAAPPTPDVSYHEARHLVAAHLLGFEVGGLTLNADPDTLGVSYHRPPAGGLDTRDAAAVVAAAGQATDAVAGLTLPDHVYADRAKVARLTAEGGEGPVPGGPGADGQPGGVAAGHDGGRHGPPERPGVGRRAAPAAGRVRPVRGDTSGPAGVRRRPDLRPRPRRRTGRPPARRRRRRAA